MTFFFTKTDYISKERKLLGCKALVVLKVTARFKTIRSDPRNSVNPQTRLPYQIGRTTLQAIYTQPNQIDYLPLHAI